MAKKRNVGDELVKSAEWILSDVRGKAKRGRTHTVLVPNIKHIRRKLQVSQAEFAHRFGLNLRTVQQWEQGRAIPDQPARILLAVIDRAPAAVERTVKKTQARARN